MAAPQTVGEFFARIAPRLKWPVRFELEPMLEDGMVFLASTPDVIFCSASAHRSVVARLGPNPVLR